MTDARLVKALANDRRLQIIELAERSEGALPPQVDGDLVKDRACAAATAGARHARTSQAAAVPGLPHLPGLPGAEYATFCTSSASGLESSRVARLA